MWLNTMQVSAGVRFTGMNWFIFRIEQSVMQLFFSFLLVFDQLDLVTYEEVIRLDYFKRKALVLLGKNR